jgi:hypothetical protein
MMNKTVIFLLVLATITVNICQSEEPTYHFGLNGTTNSYGVSYTLENGLTLLPPQSPSAGSTDNRNIPKTNKIPKEPKYHFDLNGTANSYGVSYTLENGFTLLPHQPPSAELTANRDPLKTNKIPNSSQTVSVQSQNYWIPASAYGGIPIQHTPQSALDSMSLIYPINEHLDCFEGDYACHLAIVGKEVTYLAVGGAVAKGVGRCIKTISRIHEAEKAAVTASKATETTNKVGKRSKIVTKRNLGEQHTPDQETLYERIKGVDKKGNGLIRGEAEIPKDWAKAYFPDKPNFAYGSEISTTSQRYTLSFAPDKPNFVHGTTGRIGKAEKVTVTTSKTTETTSKVGQLSENLGKRHTPNQEALTALEKELDNKGKGITREQAEILKDWSKEYFPDKPNYAHGPERGSTGRIGKQEHLNIGNFHLPITPL